MYDVMYLYNHERYAKDTDKESFFLIFTKSLQVCIVKIGDLLFIFYEAVRTLKFCVVKPFLLWFHTVTFHSEMSNQRYSLTYIEYIIMPVIYIYVSNWNQWGLTYPDLTNIRIIHLSGWDTKLGTDHHYNIEKLTLNRVFSYTDSHLGNGGVHISEGPP